MNSNSNPARNFPFLQLLVKCPFCDGRKELNFQEEIEFSLFFRKSSTYGSSTSRILGTFSAVKILYSITFAVATTKSLFPAPNTLSFLFPTFFGLINASVLFMTPVVPFEA